MSEERIAFMKVEWSFKFHEDNVVNVWKNLNANNTINNLFIKLDLILL